MKKSHYLLILLHAFVISQCVALGQDTAESPGSDETVAEAADVKTESATARYETELKEWKKILGELRDLQARYRLAEDQQLEEISQQFGATRTRARAMVGPLREAALAAYAEAPNADRELTRYLLTMASEGISSDNFETAGTIIEALLAGACDDKRLHNMAGIVAFVQNDFDAADTHLSEAASFGVLEGLGERFYDLVAQYKEYWAQEKIAREKEAEADDLPRVLLKTNKGDILLELFENEAPETVGNFVSLVEKGFYDDKTFHRVLPNFVAQGGCPNGDGTGDPGYKIYCECYQANHRKHFRGSLSMAKGAARNTGGSQFFLTMIPTDHLNGKHTVFGRVIEGIEVLAKLQRRNPQDSSAAAIVPDKIVTAEVVRKRDHEYVPNKVR